MNGYTLKNYHEEEVEFAIRVDNSRLSVEQIAEWLKEHSQEN